MNPVHLNTQQISAINTQLDAQIKKGERWKEQAVEVMKVALMAIGGGLALTALFYASPIIPFSLVLLAPIFFMLVAPLLSSNPQATSNSINNTATSDGFNQAWGEFFKVSIGGGIELGKWLYTARVAIVVGLANAGIAALSLTTMLGAGIAYLVKNKRVSHLKELKQLLEQHRDHQAQLPLWAQRELSAYPL